MADRNSVEKLADHCVSKDDLNGLPTAAPELQLRLAALIDRFPSRQAAARIAGKSDDQIIAYAKGRASPTFETVLRLARSQGISLDWLAGGDGPMMTGLRPGFAESQHDEPHRHDLMVPVLAGAIQTIDTAIQDSGQPIPVEQRAEAIARLYAGFAAASQTVVQALLQSVRK
jgi:transcriptional regulator with XRE-family HTH domain